MTMTGWAVLFAALLGIYLVFDHFKTKRLNRENPVTSPEAPIPHLSEEEISTENRVRKDWWLAFIVYTVWGAISMVIQMIDNRLNPSVQAGAEDIDPAMAVVSEVFFVLIFLLYSWFTYHCAYKKRGTAWLTFLITVFSIALVFTALVYLAPSMPPEMTANLYTPLMIALTLIGTFMMLYFGVNCYRLRQVNALRKTRGF